MCHGAGGCPLLLIDEVGEASSLARRGEGWTLRRLLDTGWRGRNGHWAVCAHMVGGLLSPRWYKDLHDLKTLLDKEKVRVVEREEGTGPLGTQVGKQRQESQEQVSGGLVKRTLGGR